MFNTYDFAILDASCSNSLGSNAAAKARQETNTRWKSAISIWIVNLCQLYRNNDCQLDKITSFYIAT